MNEKNYLFLAGIFFVLISLNFCSAAHYIVGQVNDALDGTRANGHTIIVWNSSNGISDNQTDIIGPSGNSGAGNIFMIDCEMLSNGCGIGEELSIKVINNGDNYVSSIANVIVSSAGYDLTPEITLNSPPIAFLVTQNASNFTGSFNLSCYASDLDANLANITLYTNLEDWTAEETKSISGDYAIINFTDSYIDGYYIWNCFAKDLLSTGNFYTSNYTFKIDSTPPEISSFTVNTTAGCENNHIRLECNVSDLFSQISSVVFQISNKINTLNYSALISEAEKSYYYDILLGEFGNWSFECIVNDTLGNIQFSDKKNLIVFPEQADLIVSEELNFSKPTPIENEQVEIKAQIYNSGCSEATEFLVNFYNGNPFSGGIKIGGDTLMTLGQLENKNTSIFWNSEIGKTNIFVFADSTNQIAESNETDNLLNNTIRVNSWQIVYGNLSAVIAIGVQHFNVSMWFNNTNVQGNVYVTDKESEVDWGALLAIGIKISLEQTTNDFSDVDFLLGTSSFEDSISKVFTDDGLSPKETREIMVAQKVVSNVPIADSTNTSSFFTGILWDSSDDSDGEYSSTDKEDLIFVSSINRQKQGAYGIYDYEIKVPAKLREYNSLDNSEVYFYYDLV